MFILIKKVQTNVKLPESNFYKMFPYIDIVT